MQVSGPEESEYAGSSNAVLLALVIDVVLSFAIISPIAAQFGLDGNGYKHPDSQITGAIALIYPAAAYFGLIASVGRWSLGVVVNKRDARTRLESGLPIRGIVESRLAEQIMRVAALAIVVATAGALIRGL